ncbi:MAG: hypothetical protein K8U57_25255 [Planctomycetes bacterium]|nr:hypothetical protein [Planctomycetota bacterium]
MKATLVGPSWLLALVAFLIAAEPNSVCAQPTQPVSDLKDTPVNTWAKVVHSKTGRRESPVFVYVPGVKKFVLASGMQSTGGVVPRHYDTEEFELSTLKWTNAYPPAVAAGRPESGPVGEEYSKARVNQGSNGPVLFYKDGDHLRPGAGGQWLTTKLNYEYCCVPETGKVYAYLHDKTICYDPASRTWEDLKAKPRESCRIWGSMCYDPINKEILHSGGDGGSADVSTWVYSIEKNEWRRLEFGSAKFKELAARAGDVRWQAKALLGACCSRFAITETDDETKTSLTSQAVELASAAEKFLGEIKAAGLTGTEKVAGEVAVRRLTSAIAATKAAGPTLTGNIDPGKIAAVRAVRVSFEQVVDALAAEPPGRARSQTAYDPVHKKIVLFGGDGLDRVLSDTWLYDCPTRTWEQRFPEKCPAPRAGHILGWLPKAKQIVLAGGYSRDWLAQEIWSYEVDVNEWKMLLHVPLVAEEYGRVKFSQNCPRVTSRSNQVGAVNEDDVLVCVTSEQASLITWACKVDPSKADDAGTAAKASTSGSYTFNRIDPALWENAAKPDRDKQQVFLNELPANQWTSLRFPMYAPGAANRWGTTAYDPDRHQLLFWGGGHSTSQEDDVAHFSLRGGFWTIGYHPDDPIEIIYASVPTPLSYNDRVHVPIHAYKAYCYDSTARKMFYFDRAYNPAVREWEPTAVTGLDHSGPMHSFLTPTPSGTVTYSAKGLFRFDAKAGKWQKLPWNGPAFGSIWCDGHALLYDSKRDCLWLTNEKDVFRYDLATGKAEKLEMKKPKVLGQFIFWGEQVYLPDADLVLMMRLFKRPDGRLMNVVWDPIDKQFYWADLKFVENNKPAEFKESPFSWSDALSYDPKLKLLVLNNSSARKVWLMKFDRKTAALEEMKDE